MKQSALFSSGKITAYTDGGSRGNPGPAALGVVIEGREYGEYLGARTNNFAEYSAVLFALKKIKQLCGKARAKESDVEIRMDSELVAKQLNHEYKIENAELQPLFLEIWNLMLDFRRVTFYHVPRSRNTAADRVVNRVLDALR